MKIIRSPGRGSCLSFRRRNPFDFINYPLVPCCCERIFIILPATIGNVCTSFDIHHRHTWPKQDERLWLGDLRNLCSGYLRRRLLIPETNSTQFNFFALIFCPSTEFVSVSTWWRVSNRLPGLNRSPRLTVNSIHHLEAWPFPPYFQQNLCETKLGLTPLAIAGSASLPAFVA